MGNDNWFVSLDPSDYPHICYLAKSYEIIYTGWTGTSWNTHTVNTTIPTRGPYYLAMDSIGDPHISFRGKGPGQSFNDVGNHIMYATMNNTVPEGSQPTLPVIENLPLVLATVTFSVGAVMLLVYVWKRKTPN